MKLKITFYTQIRALFGSVIVIGFFVIFFIYMNADVELNLEFYVYVILPLALITFGPVSIMHINYYIASKNIFYEIEKNKIIIMTNSKTLTYQADEISEIIFYMTANKLKDSAGSNFLYEFYYYAKIIFLNNEETIITCLHSDKIDEILADNFGKIKTSKINTFYPIIRKRAK